MSEEDIEIDVLELLDLWWSYERRWTPVRLEGRDCGNSD